MNLEAGRNHTVQDVYLTSAFYRYLALIAALLAWTFDGVEQGVYTIMTRPALKDIMPAIKLLDRQQMELNAQLDALIVAKGATMEDLAKLKSHGSYASMLPEGVEWEASQTSLNAKWDSLGNASGAAPGDLQQLKTLSNAVFKKLIDGPVGWFYSLAVAMWLWGAACGGVIFGRMGDRYGRVRSLIFAVIVYSGFTGLSALSFHWSHLAVCRFLGAIGLGGAWPLSVALIVETWPDRHRSVLAGLMGAGANVGFFIASKYSGWMSHYSWRWIIGMGFVIGISSLLVIAFVPEPGKWRASREKKQHSSLGDLFHARYIRSTIVGSLLSTVALLGTWGSYLWMSTYVDQIAQGTPDQLTAKSTIALYQSYGQIIGGFMGGVLAGWMGNKRSWIMLCIMAWASVFTLFGWNETFGPQALWMGAFAGLFVTAFFGWLPKYLPELFPTRIRATSQGFSFNIGRVIAGFGVLGTGALVEAYGGDYRKGVMTICSVYLVGLLIIFFAPNTGGKMVSDEEDEKAMMNAE